MGSHSACSEQYIESDQRFYGKITEKGLGGIESSSEYRDLSTKAVSVFWAVIKGIFIASVATVAVPALFFFTMILLADVTSVESTALRLISRVDGYVGMLMVLNLVIVLIGFTVPDILHRKSRNSYNKSLNSYK
ncbi:hypothetical protein SAMN02745866_00600 [Alteromonadaceae bacterium Bs31]|nr:hypothetical protein SAMN02745866_00600 [Alteromonadaceae bacterium Bs31]